MYAIHAFVPGFGFLVRDREPERARDERAFRVVPLERRLRRRPVDLDLMPPTATAWAAV